MQTVNFTLEVKVLLISLFIVLISIIHIRSQFLKQKNTTVRYLGLLWLSIFGLILFQALAYLFLSIPLMRIYHFFYIPCYFFIIRASDSLTRYDYSAWKMLIFGVFVGGLVGNSFGQDNIEIRTLPNGDLTFNSLGALAFWVSLYGIIQAYFWVHQSIQIYRHAPKDLKKPAGYTLFGGIYLAIIPYLTYLLGFHRFLPGTIFLNLAIGTLLVTLSLSNEPQLYDLLLSISEDVKTQYFRSIQQKLSETEKKLEEKQKQLIRAQKMESLGTLAGGIAHDFNNIMQIIIGNAELISSSDKSDDEVSQSIVEIENACEKGTKIAKQILAYSRKSEQNFAPIDFSEQILSAIKIFERTFPKQIQLKIQDSPDKLYLFGDSNQLQQVFMNLLINARDAMEVKGGEILFKATKVNLTSTDCEAKPPLKPGEYLMVIIRDSGIGMGQETLAHLFEPFYTTKAQGKGTGLGLFIVYSIIKNHNGFIQCYSEIGKGTEFKMYFPIYNQSNISTLEESPTQMDLLRGTETILVVDDEESIRRTTQKVLEENGFRVLLAENGQEALDTYQTQGNSIDLIILDISMPKMGGKQFLQTLSAESQQLPKVLINTGFTTEDPSGMISDFKVAGVLSKPFRARELLQQIRNTLDRK